MIEKRAAEGRALVFLLVQECPEPSSDEPVAGTSTPLTKRPHGRSTARILRAHALDHERGRVENGRGFDAEAAPFPVPAHQTGRAVFPHLMLSTT